MYLLVCSECWCKGQKPSFGINHKSFDRWDTLCIIEATTVVSDWNSSLTNSYSCGVSVYQGSACIPALCSPSSLPSLCSLCTRLVQDDRPKKRKGVFYSHLHNRGKENVVKELVGRTHQALLNHCPPWGSPTVLRLPIRHFSYALIRRLSGNIWSSLQQGYPQAVPAVEEGCEQVICRF